MKIFRNLQKNKGPAPYEAKGFHSGFVLIFAVTIASIVLAIALGIANIAVKEIKFGTNARDTNSAFFAADTGIEYTLLQDKPLGSICSPAPCSWNVVIPNISGAGQSCAKVTVDRTTVLTTIISKGYNIGDASCNSSNPDRIERQLKVAYGYFGPPPGTQALTVSKAGSGSGTVTSNPSGINCGATCSFNFNDGTPVTLSNSPGGGSTFAGWSGDCSGVGACNVTMSQARNVTATFNTTGPTNYDLTVSKNGTGTGTVTSNVGPINCGATCAASYSDGTAVVLTASPTGGSTFVGWSGDCSGVGTCNLTMDSDQSVIATFSTSLAYGGTPWPIAGTIQTENFDTGGEGVSYHDNVAGNLGGQYRTTEDVDISTTTDSGGGYIVGWINAGEWLKYSVNVATTGSYTFTMRYAAIAATGAVMHMESDGVDITGPITIPATGAWTTFSTLNDTVNLTSGLHTLSFVLDTNGSSTYAANINHFTFTLNSSNYDLTVSKNGTGTGTVTSNVGGINCGATCTASYSSGTVVTLTGTQAGGSTFAGWSGEGCSGTGTCVVTMSQARNVTATFNLTPVNYDLTVSKNGTGTGTVTSNVGGINCGATCVVSYSSGTVVTLTGTQSGGSSFTGWSGEGCTGIGTCIVTMSQARNVTATFDLIPSSFPVVAGTNVSSQNSDTLNHTVLLPASIAAGDLLIVFFASDGNPVITWPAGWTQMFVDSAGVTDKFEGRYRIATGSEGASITITTGVVEQSAHQSFRITGFTGTPEVSAVAKDPTGNTTTPNSLNLVPSWGLEKTLWISAVGRGNGTTTTTGYPASYTNGTSRQTGNAGAGASADTARRNLEVSAEDPGNFTLSGAQYWVAFTVAIQGL